MTKKVSGKKPTKKKKAGSEKVIPEKGSNAQRGLFPRVKPSLRIATSTNSQLRKWGEKKCTRGMGDVLDRVVHFAKRKKFDPCKKSIATATIE